MTSTSQTNQKTAKAASTQMINTVFARMDAYQRHSLHPHLDLKQLERLSQSRPSEESKDDMPVEVVFNPLDVYLHGLVRNLVDYVCLN